MNENLNEVVENVTENAPQIVDAAKEIVVKVPNILAERAKGAGVGLVAGITLAWAGLKGIPKLVKKIKDKKAEDFEAADEQVFEDAEFREVETDQEEVQEETTDKK